MFPLPALPLSKTCDPADQAQLRREWNTVVQEGQPELAQQHPMRVWEYAMALHAVRAWQAQGHTSIAPPYLLDVGGAGSPLARLTAKLGCVSEVVDPTVNVGVEQWTESADVILSISTIEHVHDTPAFLRACASLLDPGGLLFLTMDYREADGPDTCHFHWMRERIYTKSSYVALRGWLEDTLGFGWLGAADLQDHGPQVYDYTFASLALQKLR